MASWECEGYVTRRAGRHGARGYIDHCGGVVAWQSGLVGCKFGQKVHSLQAGPKVVVKLALRTSNIKFGCGSVLKGGWGC